MDYIFLDPVPKGTWSKRDYNVLNIGHSPEDLSKELDKLGEEVIHFDFETQGLDALSDEQVVSCSFATTNHVFVCDAREWGNDHWHVMIRLIAELGGMAYNSNFDFRWLFVKSKELGYDDRVVLDSVAGCTLTLFRMLANERYLGQRYDLGTAQDFLNLPSNKTWLKDALAQYGLKKDNMWRLIELELDDFLKYNAEDSDVSVLLWNELCSQLERKGMEHIIEYHQNEVALQISEMIEQWYYGLPIDVEALTEHYHKLRYTMVINEGQFKHHPLSIDYITRQDEKLAEEHYRPRIHKKKVWAKKADDVPHHPEGWNFISNAKPIARWEKDAGGRFCKYESKVVVKEGEAPLFNMNSGDQLRKLFFEHLYNFEVFEHGKRRMCKIFIDGREVVLKLTKAAQVQRATSKMQTLPFEVIKANGIDYLPLNKETYPIFGELGKLLAAFNKAEKEAGYVKKCLERCRSGKVHLDFVSNGTMTGRANGAGGFNFLQQPKTEGYMSCMVPEEGYTFVDLDIDGLEKVVQAEYSQDSALLELYASGNPHDVYLFNAMDIHPDPEFRETLRSMYKCDKEALAALKKEFKSQRTFIKPAVLGLDYGLFPYSLYIGWLSQGYDVTEQDCYDVFNNYWQKYSGVKEWEKELLAEREYRGGYILNGFGHPISIIDAKKNDVVNTFCLHAETKVLTNSGWKDLIDVEESDMLWDGDKWCSHDGVLDMGIKHTIVVNGVCSTSDHKFLGEDGEWYTAEEFERSVCTRYETAQLQEAVSGSWSDVWKLGSYIYRNIKRRFKSVLSSKVSTYSRRSLEILFQFKGKKDGRL